MFEFKKICDSFEKLSMLERKQLLEEKSSSVFHELQCRSLSGVEPKVILAGLMIGSAMVDGKLNEMEYLLMYPSLVKTFGDDFDFCSLKVDFQHCSDAKKTLADYTEKVLSILKDSGKKLKRDIVILCLCTTSTDRRITLKEKQYIRYLCEALAPNNGNGD